MRPNTIAFLTVLILALAGCADTTVSSTEPAVAAAPSTEAQMASSTTSTTSVTTSTSTTTGPPTTTRPTATPTVAPVSPGAASVTILVIGDFGSGVSAEGRVAAAMREEAQTGPIDALVTTGDNLYNNDVDGAWNQPFGWVDEAGIPVFAAWGNHDVASGARVRAVQEALNPPGDWYWVRIGPANLVVLDGNDPTNQEQIDWLDETLAGLPAGPILVSFHQPAYSCGSHGSTKVVDEEWVPRFQRAGVDLVLNGHDHDYQRFEASGVTYVVTGAGGRGLYEVGSCPKGTPEPIASNDTDHSFLVVTITADHIQAQAISDKGETLDDFSIQVG